MTFSEANSIQDLAEQLSTPSLTATVRIAVITGIDAGAGHKVTTDQTDAALISRSEDVVLSVGDRVWLLQQGTIFIVGGRLSGEPGGSPIGAVTAFAGAAAPAGWLIADGSAVSRTTYALLFALLSTTYGAGDGSTTFNLPDLRGRAPIGVSGGHARGASGGAETTTLSTSQLPAHDHGSVGDHTHTVQSYTVDDRTKAASLFSTLLPTPSGTNTSSAAGGHTHSSVGSGASVPIMSPYLTLPYIIRAL